MNFIKKEDGFFIEIEQSDVQLDYCEHFKDDKDDNYCDHIKYNSKTDAPKCCYPRDYSTYNTPSLYSKRKCPLTKIVFKELFEKIYEKYNGDYEKYKEAFKNGLEKLQ